MRFETLTLNRFRSFINTTVLDLSAGPGLVLVTGRNEVDPMLAANGVGKSTLFDALCWVLSGKTGRGGRGPSVLPEGKDGPALVTLQGTNRGNSFVLTRQQSPNKLMLDTTGKPEIIDQKALDAFIGVDYDEFLRGCYHVQGAVGFIELRPALMLDELSSYLNLAVYDEAQADAVSKYTQAHTATTAAQAKLVAAAENIIRAREQEAALGADSAMHARQRLQAARLATGALKAAQRRLDNARKAYVGVQATMPRPSNKEWKLAFAAFEKARDRFKAADDLELKLSRERVKLDKALKEGECPLCGQPLHDYGKMRLAARRANEQHDEAAGKLDMMRERMNRAAKKANALEKELAEEVEIYELEMAEHIKKIAKFESKVEELEREKERIGTMEDPYEAQLVRVETAIRLIERETIESNEELARAADTIGHAGYWRKGFKDLKLYVIKQAVARFSLAANDALHSLGMVDWQVALKSESMVEGRGKLEVAITRGDGVARDPSELSYGELQRVKLAFELGLGDLCLSAASTTFNVELWDEPTNWLSEQGVRQLLSLLERRAHATNKRIYVADHRLLEYGWSAVVEVVKDGEGSRVVTGSLSHRQEVRAGVRPQLRV
jgi:DNA repair exonuclease SbcCD ATPase subunit